MRSDLLSRPETRSRRPKFNLPFSEYGWIYGLVALAVHFVVAIPSWGAFSGVISMLLFVLSVAVWLRQEGMRQRDVCIVVSIALATALLLLGVFPLAQDYQIKQAPPSSGVQQKF